MNSKNKDMTCVREFAKAYPNLLSKIIAEHPEYMVDGSIVKLCTKDSATLTRLLGENFSGQGNLGYEAADPWMEYTKEGMNELLTLRLEAADQRDVKTIMPNYIYDGSEESAKKLANDIHCVIQNKQAQLGKRTEFDDKDVQEDQPSVKKSKKNDDYNNARETEIDEKRDNMDDEKNQDIQVSQPTVQDLWNNAWIAENDEKDRSEEAANLFQQCQDRVQHELNLYDIRLNNLMSDIVRLKIQGNNHFNQGQKLRTEGNNQDALNEYKNAYDAFRAAAAIAADTDTIRFIDCMDLANSFIGQCEEIENPTYLAGADTHTQYQH